MQTLYHSPYSTCSQKVRLCLFEKKIDFEAIELDFWKEEHLTPEYLALNPNGVVPTLVHNGEPVIDSSVIVEYLDEVFPDPALSPPDALGKAKMRAWLRFLEEVPTVAIRVPSFNKAFVQLWADKSDEELEHQAQARPLRTALYQSLGRDGVSKEEYDASLKRLRMTIERMEKALSADEWICGNNLSLADICVIPTIDRMNDLGLSHIWSDTPNVQRWWSAVQKLDCFKQTFAPGSRVTERYPVSS